MPNKKQPSQKSTKGQATQNATPPKPKKKPFKSAITKSGHKHKIKIVSGGGRDNFRDAFKNLVDAVYHPKFAPAKGATFSIVKAGLDRCHRLSYDSMRTGILDFIEGVITQKQLNLMAHTVIGNEINAMNDWPMHRQSLLNEKAALAKQQPTQLAAEAQAETSIKAINEVLNFLNNRPENVTLGNARINRGIGKRNDFHFELNQKGQYSMSPRSRRHAEIQVQDPDLLHPVYRGKVGNKPAVWSSHVNNGSGGLVPEHQMSPRSRKHVQHM